ncbi:MAG: glutamyl-tRNA reductase [Anaerolineae bacterium]
MKPIILMVGLNHTTAPIHIRERVASDRCMREQARDSLFLELSPSVFDELLVLSTCNRTEIYAVTTEPERGRVLLRRALGAYDTAPDAPGDYLYADSDRTAVEHLFAVASGIDSMLIGDFEILGQVREAYARAAERKTVGPILHQLFQHAVLCGKRARAETAIGAGATSVAYGAVAMARQQLGDLKGRVALVIGAGEMGRRAATNLAEDGACAVMVASRTLSHAQDLATELCNSEVIPFSELAQALPQADLVISATKAPHMILSARQVAEAMRARPDRPLCLVDIAVPRDIDPAAAQTPNVSLRNIDDLQDLVANNRAARAQAVADVRPIIAAEVGQFWEWFMSRRAAPVLSQLNARAEAIRQAELERTYKRLNHLNLSERDRDAIAALSAGIVKKLLAAPRTNLKERMQGGDGQMYLDLMSELFELNAARGDQP